MDRFVTMSVGRRLALSRRVLLFVKVICATESADRFDVRGTFALTLLLMLAMCCGEATHVDVRRALAMHVDVMVNNGRSFALVRALHHHSEVSLGGLGGLSLTTLHVLATLSVEVRSAGCCSSGMCEHTDDATRNAASLDWTGSFMLHAFHKGSS